MLQARKYLNSDARLVASFLNILDLAYTVGGDLRDRCVELIVPEIGRQEIAIVLEYVEWIRQAWRT